MEAEDSHGDWLVYPRVMLSVRTESSEVLWFEFSGSMTAPRSFQVSALTFRSFNLVLWQWFRGQYIQITGAYSIAVRTGVLTDKH